MAKILLTGGAGYIGSHVLKYLLKANHDIVVVDNLSTGRKESVLGGKLIIADLENHHLMNQIFQEEKFDACMHFAASIKVPDSLQKPLSYYSNNTINSYSLINLCDKYHVNKFIFSSTAAVYGNPITEKITEYHPLNPISPYGRTKLMTEWMLKDFAHANENFKYITLRYFNVSGADVNGEIGQCFPGATHLIKKACQVAHGQQEKMHIFGNDYQTEDGTCIRDFIHVDDLAIAHCLCLNHLLNNGESETFNCGYGYGYSVSEVIDVMKKISGNNFKVEIAQRRTGDAQTVISDPTKIKTKLNWKPEYNDLDLICRTAFNWEKQLLN